MMSKILYDFRMLWENIPYEVNKYMWLKEMNLITKIHSTLSVKAAFLEMSSQCLWFQAQPNEEPCSTCRKLDFDWVSEEL